MSAAVCGKRAPSSFFDDQPSPPPHPPSKRARFRSGGGGESPSPPRPSRGGADPGLVDAIRARFPAADLELIEKALEDCENDLDSATKCLLNLHVESTGYNVAQVSQSPMSTEGQLPAEGISDDKEVATSVETVPSAENLPSSNTHWVEVLVNEMSSASSMDDAKARAFRVLEVFERSMTSRIGAEAHQSSQKENSVYKEQFEAVLRENTILKKAVAIQHERHKEHDERSQELQQLKQLVAQYQEQVRSLEVNNYALSMHLRQAQQGNSISGHFHRDIF